MSYHNYRDDVKRNLKNICAAMKANTADIGVTKTAGACCKKGDGVKIYRGGELNRNFGFEMYSCNSGVTIGTCRGDREKENRKSGRPWVCLFRF